MTVRFAQAAHHPDEMSAIEAQAQAADLFRRLGNQAAAAGTVISIEPNPTGYGTNFLNTLEEAAAFVERVAHSAITLVLDVGAVHMNGEFDRIKAWWLRTTRRSAMSI